MFDLNTILALCIAVFAAGGAWYNIRRSVVENKAAIKKNKDYYFAMKLYIEKQLNKVTDGLIVSINSNRKDLDFILKFIEKDKKD